MFFLGGFWVFRVYLLSTTDADSHEGPYPCVWSSIDQFQPASGHWHGQLRKGKPVCKRLLVDDWRWMVKVANGRLMMDRRSWRVGGGWCMVFGGWCMMIQSCLNILVSCWDHLGTVFLSFGVMMVVNVWWISNELLMNLWWNTRWVTYENLGG